MLRKHEPASIIRRIVKGPYPHGRMFAVDAIVGQLKEAVRFSFPTEREAQLFAKKYTQASKKAAS